MLQVNETVRLLTGLGTIGQQLCQDCLRAASESLRDPDTGLERAYREQLRATRTAVDEMLSLEQRCIEEWRSQLPEDEGLWSTHRAMLDATDAAIDSRAELWRAWFASAERVDPKSFMVPLVPASGAFPWVAAETPAGSPQRRKGGTPRMDAAAPETVSGGSAAE